MSCSVVCFQRRCAGSAGGLLIGREADARGMQVEAQTRRQELVKHGLVEPLLVDLGRLLDEFDAVVERGQEARRVHVGGSAQLKVVADEVVRLVKALGGLNRYRFANDPDLRSGRVRAAWW